MNPRLSRPAINELSSFRAEPSVDSAGSLLVQNRGETEWWTFAPDFAGNAALTSFWSLPVSFDNLSIRTRISRAELRRAIGTRQALMAPQLSRNALPKLSPYPPESALARRAARSSQMLSPTTTECSIESPKCSAAATNSSGSG
jgi:hypothetical protein